MRKIYLSIFVMIVLVSCSTNSGAEYALFTGKVENPVIEVINISNGMGFDQSIVITEDGTFQDTLRIDAGYYTLRHGREQTNVYLSPGDNLTFNMDATRFDESINYSGEGSAVNNYLAKKFLIRETLAGDAVTNYSQDETNYKQKVMEINDSIVSALNTMVSSNDRFRDIENRNLEIEHYITLMNYESAHPYYTQKPDFKVSDTFYSEDMKAMRFDDSTDYNMYPSYRKLAMSKAMDEVVAGLGEDIRLVNPDNLKSIETLPIEHLKNQIIDNVGSALLSPVNENLSELHAFFVSNLTDEETRKKLDAKFEKNKDLVKGKPSPEFVDYENHKGGTTSLKDLRGKYVYVDVWATWCGPCIREIPFLKEIEAKYHDSNIEFVSTSIDRAVDHNKWVAMVTERELGGMQLFADKDWSSDFVKGYGIDGIPRFILIDPEGNIVSADAPRPSSPALIKLFEELNL